MRGKVITIKSGTSMLKAKADIPDGESVPDIIAFQGDLYVRNGVVFKKAIGNITTFHLVEDEKKRAGK